MGFRAGMSLPVAFVEPTPEASPEDLVEVGTYATFADGSDHGLVVLAMGGEYWLVPDGNDYRLRVAARQAAAVREQLARFDRESAGWPPPPVVDAPARATEFFSPLLWALAV